MLKKIAYSGIEGAFAHIVARKLFPDELYVSYRNFKETYESVVSGESDLAVLPIENSYSGEVNDVMDLLFEGDLYINAIYSLPVTQNLLGVRGSRISDIKKVISQPKALEQCDEYIRNMGYEAIQSPNTAVAAREVSRMQDMSVAAIASLETAAIYGLKVLDEKINERDDNTTRFVVVSREKGCIASVEGKRSFVTVFTVEDGAGALLGPLQVIAEYDYNMKVLHSRPLKNHKWQYYFYVEIEGDIVNEKGDAMTRKLEKTCSHIRVLGPHFGDK
ncbi:MAG: bifunctional chorismate mutase/prephenate dehydratase [Lachnospiraceae bacterium]|nr:bifunctional chorismate mutase/prephenate dehydratase [Lachnospiraceae bacterium]